MKAWYFGVWYPAHVRTVLFWVLIATIACGAGCRQVQLPAWHHTAVMTEPGWPGLPAVAMPIELTPFEAGDGRRVLVTPPIESASGGFGEALVSWNIDCPEGCGAVIDVCVRDSSGRWSPSLRVGHVGKSDLFDPPLRAFVGPDGVGGRIDVDYFVGDAGFRAAKVIITTAGPRGHDAGMPVRVRQVAVCLTSDCEVRRRVADIAGAANPEPVSLNVPFRSQKTPDPTLAGRLCSPASLAMALAFHGREVSVGEVASRAHDPDFDLYGNWPRNVQAAWECGVPGFVTRFNTWDAVEEHFRRGEPIIASIRAPRGVLRDAPYAELDGGHLIVLTGFDGCGGVLVNDPAVGSEDAGRRVYAMADLTEAWMTLGRGTAYVLSLPTQSSEADR